jgi:hypothetical protein
MRSDFFSLEFCDSLGEALAGFSSNTHILWLCESPNKAICIADFLPSSTTLYIFSCFWMALSDYSIAIASFLGSFSTLLDLPGDFQERCHSLAAFQAAWINGSA